MEHVRDTCIMKSINVQYYTPSEVKYIPVKWCTVTNWRLIKSNVSVDY